MREREKKVLGKAKATKKSKKVLKVSLICLVCFFLILLSPIGDVIDILFFEKYEPEPPVSEVLGEEIKQLPPLPSILNEREVFKEIRDNYNNILELQQINVLGGIAESDVNKINQIISEIESIPKETLDEIEHFERLNQERVQLKDKTSVYELSEKRINEKIEERAKNIKEEYLKNETTDDQKKWFMNEDGTWEFNKEKAHQMGEERAMREYPTRYTTRAFRQIDFDYGIAWKNYYSSQKEYDNIIDYVATIPTLAKNEVETEVENEIKRLDIINEEWEKEIISGIRDKERNLNLTNTVKELAAIYEHYLDLLGKNAPKISNHYHNWAGLSDIEIPTSNIEYFNKAINEIPGEIIFYPEYRNKIQNVYDDVKQDIERKLIGNNFPMQYANKINAIVNDLNKTKINPKTKDQRLHEVWVDITGQAPYFGMIIFGIGIMVVAFWLDKFLLKIRIRQEIKQEEWIEEYATKVIKEREQKKREEDN